MKREVSAFSLILMLFILLASWWYLAANRMPYHPLLTTDTPPPSLTIYQSDQGNMRLFSGAVPTPPCYSVATKVSSHDDPSRIELSFGLTHEASCTLPVSTTTPFSIGIQKSPGNPAPVLGAVSVNNAMAAFTVIEIRK